ncbi:MAG: nuclear transport factor 2 family protein [Ilumatobacteraceae bacterium]
MDHPNAHHYRTTHDALWDRLDIEPLFEWFTDDVQWTNDIGAGPFHRFDGKAAVLSFFEQWTNLFDGGFRHELIDVCASDTNIIAILREVGTARGHTFDNLALYRYQLDDSGRIVSVRTFDQDRESIVQFWEAIDFAGGLTGQSGSAQS